MNVPTPGPTWGDGNTDPAVVAARQAVYDAAQITGNPTAAILAFFALDGYTADDVVITGTGPYHVEVDCGDVTESGNVTATPTADGGYTLTVSHDEGTPEAEVFTVDVSAAGVATWH